MARQRISNKRLAELMGVHPNAISRLKNQDTLPQIGGETLDALCKFLDCTPNDLIEYSVDGDRTASSDRSDDSSTDQ